MENLSNLVSVPLIIAAVYAVMTLYKYSVKVEKPTPQQAAKMEKCYKLIPILSALLGAVLGLLCFKFAPSVMPADNFLVAMLTGGASGLAATGTNQIFKQMHATETKPADNDQANNDQADK